MVAHTFDSHHSGDRAEDSEFKVILIFTGVTEQSGLHRPCLKKKKGCSKDTYGRVYRISRTEVSLEDLCECAACVRGRDFYFEIA